MRTGFSESAESPKMELTPLTPESAVSAGCFKAKRRACLKPHTNHTGKQEPRAPRRALRPSGPDKLPSRHARTRAPARAHPHGTAISAARQSSRPASPDAHGRPRHTPAKKSPRRAASPRPSLPRADPAAASAAATVPPAATVLSYGATLGPLLLPIPRPSHNPAAFFFGVHLVPAFAQRRNGGREATMLISKVYV